jgi:hypothetical protein
MEITEITMAIAVRSTTIIDVLMAIPDSAAQLWRPPRQKELRCSVAYVR